MKRALLSIIAIAAFSAASAVAGDGKSFKETKVVVEPEVCVFKDYEFSLDAFFAGVVGQGEAFQGGVGGGTGANFFFLKYFGIGAEAWWYGNGGTAEHNITGTFQIRYPICSLRLAPYVLVGGGAHFDGEAKGSVQVGGGVEWRAFDHVGFFADGRGVITGPDSNTFGLFRTGIRFVF